MLIGTSFISQVRCCYISALVLTCFRLKKGHVTFFRPETIVASFLHLMVLFFKLLLNHSSKRQFLVLHCHILWRFPISVCLGWKICWLASSLYHSKCLSRIELFMIFVIAVIMHLWDEFPPTLTFSFFVIEKMLLLSPSISVRQCFFWITMNSILLF